MVVRGAVIGVLVAGLSAGPALDAGAQTPSTPSSGAPSGRTAAQPPMQGTQSVDVDELPISVDRIGRRLSLPGTISLELSQPMFRTEVIETRPKWLGDIQWLPPEDADAPWPTGPAWHREFLNMVTPQQVRPFGQVQGLDLLQLVASSFAQGVATNMLAGKIKKAVERRRAERASAEVDAAIEAWKRDREHATTSQPSPASEPPAAPATPPR